jgi:hypothetical protein
MTLDDIEISPFGMFVNWIYYQRIQGQEGTPDAVMLAKLWVLAQPFLISGLQNKIMCTLYTKSKVFDKTFWKSFIEFAEYAYKDEDRIKLRKIAAQRVMWVDVEKFEEIIDKLPQRMYKDLVIACRGPLDSIKTSDLEAEMESIENFYVQVHEAREG